ncbi:hypothetical protein ACHAPT_010699 [Fusarium lateritium]
MTSLADFVALGGHTSIEDPKVNLQHSFEGEATAYGLTNTLHKIIFSYPGYDSVLNVVSEVSYATYAATGLGALVLCGAYHWLWIEGIPRDRGYKLRQEAVRFGDSVRSQTLVKAPLAETQAWDATHDHAGHRLDAVSDNSRQEKQAPETKKESDSSKEAAK